MPIERIGWVKEQIPNVVQQDPASLVPIQIKKILQRWGHPKDAQDILAIQEALRQLVYNPWELDGVFKIKDKVTFQTMLAISDFQRANGLIVDWQPWIRTLRRMLDQLEHKVKNPSKTQEATIPKAEIPKLQLPVKVIAPKSILQTNIAGLKWASSILRWGSLFASQSLDNIRWAMNKPQDDLHHRKDAKTAILIPWFLCNQGVMKQLWDQLSKSMNVIYPNIGALEQWYKSLPELADSIANYVIDLEDKGLLKKDGEYTIIGHSLWWSLAILVTSKLRARHIIQVSTPNRAPDVSKISGFGYIPALFDLRNIESAYQQVQPKNPIERLTSIIPKNDIFIGTDVQWFVKVPGNIRVNTIDKKIVEWWHIDPIFTTDGIQNIVNIANQKD